MSISRTISGSAAHSNGVRKRPKVAAMLRPLMLNHAPTLNHSTELGLKPTSGIHTPLIDSAVISNSQPHRNRLIAKWIMGVINTITIRSRINHRGILMG